MSPLLARELFPLESTPENQVSELIHRLLLGARLFEIGLQLPQEFRLTACAAFQPDLDERGDGLAHTRVRLTGVTRYLSRHAGSESDRVTRFGSNAVRRCRYAVSSID